MKIRQLWLSGFLVALFLGCFSVSLAHAQFPNLTGWEEKWFKLTVKTTGVVFDGLTSKIKTGNENFTNYLLIKDFSPPRELTCDVWQENELVPGSWFRAIENLKLKIIAGTELDFLFVTTIESDDALGAMFFGFVARITGRKTQGVLKSATLKSLGGFSWEQELGISEYFAAGVSINGTLTTKLPFTPTP